jgi:hypothetical protein
LERVGGHLDLVLLLPGEAVSHQGAYNSRACLSNRKARHLDPSFEMGL